MRLGARQRVRLQADFLRVRTEGRRWEAPGFAVQAAARADPHASSRLGVIASRRVGGAVQRNRAKRLLREAFRQHQGDLPPGLDVILVARPALVQKGIAEVRAGLLAQLPKLRRVAGSPPVAPPPTPSPQPLTPLPPSAPASDRAAGGVP